MNQIKTAIIKLNGQNRFTVQNANYFTYVQNYEIGKTTPKDGIYTYSFALFSFDHQPSGSCNFSKLDTSILTLTFADNIPASVVVAYAINYNVFKIMEGFGSLSYTS